MYKSSTSSFLRYKSLLILGLFLFAISTILQGICVSSLDNKVMINMFQNIRVGFPAERGGQQDTVFTTSSNLETSDRPI